MPWRVLRPVAGASYPQVGKSNSTLAGQLPWQLELRVMEDPRELTVSELLVKLRADVVRNRKIEMEAHQEAQRAERAIAALESVVGESVQDQVEQTTIEAEAQPQATNGDGPRGEAAVLAILKEQPRRGWMAADVHAALEARGWISPQAKHPRAGTDAALNRLVNKGVLRRKDRHYFIPRESPVQT